MDSLFKNAKFYPEIIRTAKTESGVVRGIPGGIPIYTVYKGVPYAAPPVGELRWKAPQPVTPWEGELVADTFSAIAPQHKHPVDSLYGKEFFQNPEEMSEDCLYLNIWTPAKTPDEKLPVLFWIHGGGLNGGYGTEPEFDGEAFCREGVILVTFNYRLGILGFYANAELSAESEYGASGNYGHLDQVAALKWVRKNIAAFGGDPDRITIFGQSAGAGSVQTLVNSPLTKGDIHGAIVMSGVFLEMLSSGGPMRGADRAKSEAIGKEYMEAANCKSIDELRKLSYEELAKVPGMGFGGKFMFGTVVDGYLLPGSSNNGFYSGTNHDIPYMFGNTSDEGGLGSFGPKQTFEEWKQAKKVTYGDRFDEFIETVGVKSEADLDSYNKQAHSGMVGNRVFAEMQLAHNRKPAYVYCFNRKLPGNDDGAFHSSELWYVFGTVDRCWRPMTGVDYDLSLVITKCWANFAKNADPNGEGVPAWEPYTDSSRKNMILGEKVYLADIEETPAQKFDREFVLSKA